MNIPNQMPQVPRKQSSGGVFMLVSLFLIAPLTAFVPSLIVLFIGLIPTYVAFVVDNDSDRLAPMTVGAMNFAGAMPFVMMLWHKGEHFQGVLLFLGTPLVWLVMYSAAAMGWLIFFIVPPTVSMFHTFKAENQIKEYKAQQKRMAEIWGDAVGGFKLDE